MRYTINSGCAMVRIRSGILKIPSKITESFLTCLLREGSRGPSKRGMYTYEKYYFRLFSPLLGLMAFIFFLYGEVIGGTVSLVLGILVSFSYQGIRIDPVKKRYMKYDRFFRLYIGRWEPLSPPGYVTLVRINLTSFRNMPSPLALPDDRKSARSYKINLVVDGKERYISVCRGKLVPMREEALRLGKLLGIRVLDYSTSEKKWIL